MEGSVREQVFLYHPTTLISIYQKNAETIFEIHF